MLDKEGLSAAAEELMSAGEVVVEGKKYRMKRVGSGRLRTVEFVLGGKKYQAIEQNPKKLSRWGKMAKAKHRVVQFRDLEIQKYVAVSVDGKVLEYGGKE